MRIDVSQIIICILWKCLPHCTDSWIIRKWLTYCTNGWIIRSDFIALMALKIITVNKSQPNQGSDWQEAARRSTRLPAMSVQSPAGRPALTVWRVEDRPDTHRSPVGRLTDAGQMEFSTLGQFRPAAWGRLLGDCPGTADNFFKVTKTKSRSAVSQRWVFPEAITGSLKSQQRLLGIVTLALLINKTGWPTFPSWLIWLTYSEIPIHGRDLQYETLINDYRYVCAQLIAHEHATWPQAFIIQTIWSCCNRRTM